jgi:hypothetical protein
MAPDDPQNPFAPPQSADALAPPRDMSALPGPPSSVPKVFGVLSIIFASIVMLGGLLGSCSMCAGQMMGSVPQVGPHAAEMRAMIEPMKTVYNGIGLQSLLLLAMSVWLLVIGIGQLRYRAWAQKQSVAWGGAGLIGVGLMVAMSVLMIGPAYKEMFDALAHMPDMGRGTPQMQMPSGMGTLLGGSMSAIIVVLYAPYPILMLAMFSREHVKASMTN